MSNDLLKIESALKSVEKIIHYTAEEEFEKFAQNDMKIDAVLMQLINLGEKFGTLSKEFKTLYPHLPYRESKDMRNYTSAGRSTSNNN